MSSSKPKSQPQPDATRTITATVTASTVAALPSLLLAGLAVLVKAELGFGAFELGAAIATFYAVSGLGSVPAGVLSEQIGPRRALVVGGIATAIGLVGAGLLSPSWVTLLPWMAVGGLGNTITLISSNHLLAQQVLVGRQGLAFGINQSAIPLAGMLAGLALPIVGVTAGWRVTYLVAALGLIPVLLLLRGFQRTVWARGGTPRAGDAPIPTLVVLSIAAGLGSAAGSSLTTFTVESAVHAGFAVSVAGVLLAGASLAGVSTRVVSGWVADRIGRGSLLLASGLLGVGAVGYLGLAAGGPAWAVVGATLIAFAGGFGYQGLVMLAVARTNPGSPAVAMGAIRVGPSIGGVIGPLAFGALVDGLGYPVAWLVAAGAALAASVLMLVTRPSLLRYRRA